MQLNANGTNQNLTCLYCMLFMFTASVRKWCVDVIAVDITARR